MVPPPLGWPTGGVAGAPPDAIGAADLVPPGLRAPGTVGGFGVPVRTPGFVLAAARCALQPGRLPVYKLRRAALPPDCSWYACYLQAKQIIMGSHV